MAIMDLPCISAELGSSVIYEEYKGNFAEAHRAAGQCLERARQQGDISGQADAWLAKGVVSLLQGEPPAALRCFDEVNRLVPDDTARRYRAAVYANLATYRQFNAFPNESGAGAAEISARWDGVTSVGQQEEQRAQLQAGLPDPALLFEGKLVIDILSTGLTSRFLLDGLGNQTPQNAQRVLEIAFQPAFRLQNELQAAGDPIRLQAFVTWTLADLCRRSRQYQPAQQLLNQANQMYLQAGDRAGMATCQMAWGDWLSAPYSTPLVWNFAIQSSSSEGNGLSWTTEAQEFGQAGLDAANAQVAYNQAEQLFQAAGAPRGLAAVNLRRAYLAMLSGDFRKAIEYARRAEDGFSACGDLQGYRVAQVQRILCRVGAGEFPEERETAGEVGAWGATEGSFSYTLGLGLLLTRAGRHWLIRRGDFERSLACFRLAEALYEKLGAAINRAQSLVDQGNVYQAVGDRPAALVLYEGALDAHAADIVARPAVAQEVRDQALSLAVTVYNLYLQQMQAEGMERSVRRMRSFLDQYGDGKGDLTGIADLLGGGLEDFISTGGDQATVVDKRIDLVKSWALTNLARSTLEQAGVLVPLYQAVQARDRGDQATANLGFTQARAAALKAGPVDRLLLESTVLAQQKEYASAVAVFKQYLAEQSINSGFTGDLVQWMAMVAGERGQEESRRQGENSLELAFTFLTRCKAYQEARQYLDALVQSAGPDWWQRDARPWLSLSDCGELSEGLNQLETALDFYDRAIGELEKRRNQLSQDELKTALAADKGTQYLYFQAARTAYKLALQARQEGDTVREQAFAARLFDLAERSKARALLDLMAGSTALGGDSRLVSAGMTASVQAWRQVNAQLTLHRGLLAQERNRLGDTADSNRIQYFQGLIEADESALRQVESELAKTNPEFYRLINPQTPVMTLEQARKALPPETALLQYYFVGEELLSWAITSQGMVDVHQAPLDVKAFERRVSQFQRACEGLGAYAATGKDLAEILLAPLDGAIKAYPHLLIVPYGAAHALPFHVLPWNGEPLSATHTVRYLPSTSTLQFLAGRETPRLNSILAFGNPANMSLQKTDGSYMPAPSLPWAATEASYVASLFQPGEALVGEQATEEAFRQRLQQHNILHLATHGYLSTDSPLASSILFAGGQELTVYELMGLRLAGQLVVLSACQTAQGEITGGDDLLGLTRGLLAAGARYALVSLWPVNDLSTSLLMGEFYRRLLAGDGPALALQTAQNFLRRLDAGAIRSEIAKLLATLRTAHADISVLNQVEKQANLRQVGSVEEGEAERDYRHPAYWAPFILVG